MPRIYRLRELFSAQGRYGRGAFWGTAIPIAILNAILSFLIEMSDDALALPALVVALPLIVIGINNTTKRLHDHGRSGWWQAALVGFYICAGMMLALTGAAPAPMIVVGLAILIVALGALIYLGFIPGQKVVNRFGAPMSDTAPDRGDLPQQAS